MGSFKDSAGWSMRNLHPEKGLEQNMISKFRNAQCCLFLQQNTVPN